MIYIRLTQATWQARELDRVRSVLSHALTREDMEQDKLARLLLRYLATEYTPAELVEFRNLLAAEGVIEVEERTYAISTFAAPKEVDPEQKKFRWFWQKGKKKKVKK